MGRNSPNKRGRKRHRSAAVSADSRQLARDSKTMERGTIQGNENQNLDIGEITGKTVNSPDHKRRVLCESGKNASLDSALNPLEPPLSGLTSWGN